ncbi:MAG: ATP-binding protein [Acidobacteriota bacterium]
MALRQNPTRWAWFSPWLIMGSVCILAAILLVLAVKNVHREREFTVRALVSEANILMRSLEASSRTGMTGMGWGRGQLQILLEETAQQPDVLYTALITRTGKVVAHSNEARVGEIISVSLPPAETAESRFVEGEPRAFEVVRPFQPWERQRGGGSWERCRGMAFRDEDKNLFIMVGLDPTPFEEATHQDMRQTAVLFGVMLLVGAAGFLSLVWGQHYRDARSSLRDMRAFTSTLINQMPVGLMTTDMEGNIQRANEASHVILHQEEAIGGNLNDFPCFRSIIEQLRREGSVIEREILCPLEGGETAPLLMNAALIRDGEERSTGYVLLFTDMTNIKQLEERLRRSERLAGLGRLAAGIAHEIRNPLSSIKGFATILASRFPEEDKSRTIADVMVQEVERLNRVVTELLDYARPTELSRRSCSCADMLRHTLSLVERDARLRNIEIASTTIPEDLTLEADPDRLSQVLLNLYLNGLQAMDHGGTLKVEAFREDGRAVLNVTDTGHGIPSEHLPHIFDPYFTTKPSGVGLGLANVHKFVEAHGGEIEVASNPGQGTTFTIRLPLGNSP